jgi:hypothetical protein
LNKNETRDGGKRDWKEGEEKDILRPVLGPLPSSLRPGKPSFSSPVLHF